MAGGGGLHAFGAEQVLHANRHTRHLAERLASDAVGIDSLCGFDSLLRCFDDEGVKCLRLGDIGVEGLCNFYGRKFAGCHTVTDCGNAEFGQFGHIKAPSC